LIIIQAAKYPGKIPRTSGNSDASFAGHLTSHNFTCNPAFLVQFESRRKMKCDQLKLETN